MIRTSAAVSSRCVAGFSPARRMKTRLPRGSAHFAPNQQSSEEPIFGAPIATAFKLPIRASPPDARGCGGLRLGGPLGLSFARPGQPRLECAKYDNPGLLSRLNAMSLLQGISQVDVEMD
jgi:hypothetical protein